MMPVPRAMPSPAAARAPFRRALLLLRVVAAASNGLELGIASTILLRLDKIILAQWLIGAHAKA